MSIQLQTLTAVLPALPQSVLEIVQSYTLPFSHAVTAQRDWSAFLQSKLPHLQKRSREAEFALIEEFTERQIHRFRPHLPGIDRYAEWRPYAENKIALFDGREVSASAIDFTQERTGYHNFIATQAPMNENAHLFWQMIFENQVNQIVMLTELSEDDEELCSPYWPQKVNEKLRFENGMEVTLLEQSKVLTELKEHIEIRTCKICKDGQEKTVVHYWYRNWPDGAAPSQAETIKTLIKQVANDKNLSQSNAPIVTHCAAGVGRTGVFIPLYHQWQRIQFGEQKMDLFNLVAYLRWLRHEMVGELSQYTFCDQVQASFLPPS